MAKLGSVLLLALYTSFMLALEQIDRPGDERDLGLFSFVIVRLLRLYAPLSFLGTFDVVRRYVEESV